MSIQTIADSLKVTVGPASDATEVTRYINLLKGVGQEMQINWYIDGSLTMYQAAMVMKNGIVMQFEKISEVCALAANRGYLLPDNPYPRIQAINAQRQPWQALSVSFEDGILLLQAAVELSMVVNGYLTGEIKFDRPQPASQLASFEVSLDGIAPQSGDALSDILGYQPDADFVKRKRALDSLAKLDFSKRKPYLLFTADVMLDGVRSQKTIVCWSKMRDASSYIVKKVDVFGEKTFAERELTNADLVTSTQRLLLDENFLQIMSFYDWVGPNDFFAFIDDDTTANTLYSYKITGVQVKAPASPFVFDVQMNSLYLSPSQLSQLNDLIAFGGDTSPYPYVAQVVYGDPALGWILAGCNITASRRRNDPSEQTRSFAYVGSPPSSIVSSITSGKFFVPTRISDVQQAIENGVASYGISQALLSVLDGTGLTFFISSKDEPNGLRPNLVGIDAITGGLAKIISAIDPQTATMDTSSLLTNLTSPVVVSSTSFGLQFEEAPPAPPIDAEIIDLTTYAGIGKLMQVLRVIYDFYPGAFS